MKYVFYVKVEPNSSKELTKNQLEEFEKEINKKQFFEDYDRVIYIASDITFLEYLSYN